MTLIWKNAQGRSAWIISLRSMYGTDADVEGQGRSGHSSPLLLEFSASLVNFWLHWGQFSGFNRGCWIAPIPDTSQYADFPSNSNYIFFTNTLFLQSGASMSSLFSGQTVLLQGKFLLSLMNGPLSFKNGPSGPLRLGAWWGWGL